TKGRRSLLPPLLFGWAVLRYLARRPGQFDVVHTASFPYFPLLAAGALQRRGRYALVVDWHEVWTRSYWTRYAGTLIGALGWRVQPGCVKVYQPALCIGE